MSPLMAALTGSGIVVFTNLLIAAYVYGQLTQRVKDITRSADDHQRRIGNIETVLSGPGGHGERLTALEAFRIELRAQQK